MGVGCGRKEKRLGGDMLVVDVCVFCLWVS